MSRVAKQWRLLPHDEASIQRLAAELGIAPVVAQLLLNRGYRDPAAARDFLAAPLSALHPPDSLPGAPRAAALLWDAVCAGDKIVVYGDYDADGVTSTAILWQALRLVGGDATYYVPNRLEEGYGLNCDALRKIADSGAKWVVTVDCGVASVTEVVEADRLGLRLIVTDHHAVSRAALQFWQARDWHPVHPKLRDGDFAPFPLAPFGELSGSGVAFKLAWLIGQRASGGDKVSPKLRDFLMDALGLATIGLIADVMPLTGENRTFVRHGLKRLDSSSNLGVKALVQRAGIDTTKPLRAEDVAFRLAPRLNAAGRLGLAGMVVELLTTVQPEKAQTLAEFLEEQNRQRQSIEREIVREAREMIAAATCRDAPALVLASPQWHPGVVGIVAGRLAEQFGRPALLIAIRDGIATGSGRSVPGFVLHEALRACSDELIGHGGHAAAAGFRLDPSRIDAFRERFSAVAAAHFPSGPPRPTLNLDAELPLSALTTGLVKALSALEPFGAGNPRPLMFSGDLQVVGEPRKMGGGERHLNFRVRQGGTTLRCVAWSMAERIEELMSEGGRVAIVYTPRINEWNGYTSVELDITDFRAGSADLA
ncbi:MAG: single-stranded-DNA-specific exonuclease RecJ [Gemmataceae bacterium]